MTLALLLPAAGVAQVVTRVELDNDSFNFWQAPKVRADREYSQGTRIALLRPSTGRFVRRMLGGPDHCRSDAIVHDCRMVSWAVTQAIYTPTLDARRRQPGERPYAGWLGAEVGALREREHSLHALAFGIGVTGPASMAEPAQKAVHRLFNFQKPQGWETQLPSEVAMLASYRGARELVHLADQNTGMRLMLAPVWTLQAGTVATDATLGVQATLGFRPPAPWRGATNMRGDRWSLYLRGGAQQTAVARNLFLDGSTFTTSARVEKNRYVAQTDIGVGLRSPLGVLEWQVHNRGREYRMQPRAHAYSTITFALR
ncbi:MAG: lipid A deacylase LpxR family protein [Gemmatimonadaceae bacterium]|nr:lipid A deacylase LpxR family protein [Gemmatimonadaceae bacterium]